MAKIGVALKIDVTKIEKERLFSGAKGKYLDATVSIDLGDADKYGNHGMITQDVKKEEKEQGIKGNILGNCKVFWREQGQPQAMPQTAPPMQQQPSNSIDDDIPF